MAGLEIRESVTVAGRAERARVARAFAVGVLGPGHPCGEDAVLLVSELFGNSVRYSRSGTASGTVTVVVSAGAGLVRVEVTDRSGPGAPELCPAGRDAGCGRRPGASVGGGPGGAVGVAAAWRADGDLVRAAAPISKRDG
jgi:anti-sigma regulatory factor (Ser/Thr protein kinase)